MEFFRPRIRILWILLSLLCLAYSVMVFLVNSGTFSFAIWLVGAAFFAICYFFAGKSRWCRVPGWIRISVYTLVGAVVMVFAICASAILTDFFDEGEKNLDYIIVLGAQMRDEGPSVIYRYRLEKAAQYLLDNENTICITTGGVGVNEHISEGAGGRDYLIKLGVPVERIITEEESKETAGNIENALSLIGEPTDMEYLCIGIVTNGFHVFRGVHIARKLTNANVCGIAAYMQPQYIPNNMVRECFGIIRDLIQGKLTL